MFPSPNPQLPEAGHQGHFRGISGAFFQQEVQKVEEFGGGAFRLWGKGLEEVDRGGGGMGRLAQEFGQGLDMVTGLYP